MLEKLGKLKGKQNKKKRLGRGYGSGKGGHTIGRGTKGQKSRKSSNVNLGFEGGQVPIYKRLPHIGGFKNPNRKGTAAINIRDLKDFKDGSEITPAVLVKRGLIKQVPKGGVKILAKGKIKNKLILKGFKSSKTAKILIEKSGGQIIDVPEYKSKLSGKTAAKKE